MSTEGAPTSEVVAPDLLEALRALATCLRHRACGWSLHPAERAACLSLLQSRIPCVHTADLAAAQKILASPRCLTSRQRDRAGELAARFAEMGVARRDG
jgi:hypothetical protein